jgi:hypothetical protein
MRVALLLAVAPAAAQQTDQPTRPLEEILQRAAEKESAYATAHALYAYRLVVKVQELDEASQVIGEYEQQSEVSFDPSGRRKQRLLGNPHNDLAYLKISRIELEDLEGLPLYILTPQQIPEYDVTYLGRERVGEVDTYLLRLAPKGVAHAGDRLFEGLIWVDARQLDIVRAFGRLLPPRTSNVFKGLFQRMDVYRQPVDDVLVPTYARSDDVIRALGEQAVNAKLIVRFADHERVRQPAK